MEVAPKWALRAFCRYRSSIKRLHPSSYLRNSLSPCHLISKTSESFSEKIVEVLGVLPNAASSPNKDPSCRMAVLFESKMVGTSWRKTWVDLGSAFSRSRSF